MALDGDNIQTLNPNSDGLDPLLASWSDLSTTREHVLTLTTIPGTYSTATFTLERADVTVNTGYS